jgi:glycosyltransferase involved in cell wall biosynthesis
MPKRVLLVANFEPDGQQSMGRYAAWLERMLVRRGYSVTVTKPRPFFALLSRNASLSKYLGYIDKFILFPPKLRRLATKSDLVHIIDHSNSMYLSSIGTAPALITCHDLLAVRAARGEFPETRTGWSGRLLQRWILSGLKRAQNVVCVSQKTAADLVALTGGAESRVTVIYNTLNREFKPPVEAPATMSLHLPPSTPYFLHVGGNQWYKNRLGVLHIFCELVRHDSFSTSYLVLAGKPWTQSLRDAVDSSGLRSRIVELPAPGDDEVEFLYAHASGLLFPSFQEGFGWPILEAQACGCPVATTNFPPMSEIAGNGAIVIDPRDPAGAASAILAGLSRRDQMREAGFANLTRFSQEQIVDQYCAVYERLIGTGKPFDVQ